jgi:serine/threonine protein kinase
MVRTPRKRSLIALFVGVGVIAAALALISEATHLLNTIELNTVDTRFSVRGSDGPPRNVVLVAIDTPTFQHLQLQWPFKRSLHGQLIDRLKADGASVIVYDVQFTEPTAPAQDNALIGAVSRARNVVLSTTEVGAGGTTGVFGGDSVVRSAHAQVGFGQFPNPQGTIRRMYYETSGLKALAVVAADEFEHRTISPGDLGGREPWIDYRGPPGTIPRVSFWRALKGQVDPSFFRGKIVVVGATASSLQDIHATSAGADMAGSEVQANAIDTVLRRAPLRQSGKPIDVLLVLLLAFFAPLLSIRLKPLPALLASVGLGVLFAVVVQLIFNGGTIVPFVYPLLALVLSVIGALVVHYRTVESELRSLSEAIERLVEKINPGDTLGDYRVDELLARGGMGVVYRATQLSLNREVALKVIVPELAEDAEYRTRFQREAMLAAAINHPNVVPVYEAGEEGGLLFLAMRMINGIDLRNLLEQEGPMPPARAAHIIAQVAAALGAAHRRGLVHRDVKPANVLDEPSAGDHVYLTDFGLTRQIEAASAVTQEGTMMGTIDYMPPEQINGEAVDGRADVYALGCVLYEMLTGRVPFERDTEVAKLFAHVASEPPSALKYRPDLPEEVDEVIARAMAKEPEQRYASADEFARAAAAALGQIDPTRAGVGASRPSPSSASMQTVIAPDEPSADSAPAPATPDEASSEDASTTKVPEEASSEGASTTIVPEEESSEGAPGASTTITPADSDD